MVRYPDPPGAARRPPPSGFQPFTHTSPFLERAVGPLWERTLDGRLVVGMRVGQTHLNSWGGVHAGLLCSVADVALGQAVARCGDLPHPSLVGIDLDFIASAALGNWIEVRTEVLRAGRRLGFSAAELFADDRRIGRAKGTFAMRAAAPPSV
jgi:acyl-coenzyme A thioesterase 13